MIAQLPASASVPKARSVIGMPSSSEFENRQAKPIATLSVRLRRNSQRAPAQPAAARANLYRKGYGR